MVQCVITKTHWLRNRLDGSGMLRLQNRQEFVLML